MPLVRRIPKRGFFNKFGKVVAEINVARLETHFAAGEIVTPETLKQKAILKHPYQVLKVLGNGELSKPLQVSAHRFSQSAKEKIERAGGKASLLPPPKPVVKVTGKSSKKPAAKKK